MKGPGLRIDHDVRRVWQCPLCGRLAKAVGDVVARRCGCQKEGDFMRLVEEKPQSSNVERFFLARNSQDSSSPAIGEDSAVPPAQTLTGETEHIPPAPTSESPPDMESPVVMPESVPIEASSDDEMGGEPQIPQEKINNSE